MAEQQMTEEQKKELEEKLKNMSPEEIAELQKQQCIFCQILSGKVPSKKVYEDDKCMVVMDINPATRGHCLLLPKQHFAIMPQMPEDILSHLFIVAKAMSQVLLKSLRAAGTNVFVANGAAAGQRAPHFMIHIIPRKEGDGLFNLDSKIVDLEDREKLAEKIEARFNELMGIKKKVVRQKTLKEVEEEPAKEEPSEEEPEEGEDEEPEEDDDTEEDSDDDDSEENEDDDEDTEDDDEVPEEKEDGKTNLDDIANLFK